MRGKKISVVIPMFEGERVIEQCLRSVLGQTVKELEVLVVDDGSTDRGASVCRRIAFEDNRVRLFRQKNKGVSSARNRGLALAEGDYIFFLDSDDAIHPRLFEEMLKKAEECGAGLLFCGYKKVDDRKFSSLSFAEGAPCWETAEGREVEEWFHVRYVNELSGIGGKMVRRDLAEGLRFDEGLSNGEDTFFLYHLLRKKAGAAFLKAGWYYYRIHEESATQSSGMVRGKSYFECCRRIRDMEYRADRPDFALIWERLLAVQMERAYGAYKRGGDRKACRVLKRQAAKEVRHPMFSRLLLSEKVMFGLCFGCYPAYGPADWFVSQYLKIREGAAMKENHSDTGILTFHCSNNYGAMLQAYGLKSFLRRNGKKADIIRYEPFYMTGRHWWIPYAPIKGARGRIWGLFHMWNGFMAHLRTKETFSRQRKNMDYFRYRYLVDKKKHRILSEAGLRRLDYKYYIVGSDQIWNPDITCGLRRAYFGAFGGRGKEKVISYAASFGGSELHSCYDKKFTELIRHVDAVSVREESAVPYVRKLCGREVTAVLDPVFFLKKESWQRVERIPDKAKKENYIFLYVTEPNTYMSEYAGKLSRDTGLPVIEVRAGQQGTDAGFQVDETTGPAEFLGYIHKADYVVSNSFHAAAFSIIYEKQFLVFAHSNLGARVRNIMNLHGLGGRLCEDGEIVDIYAAIDWDLVRERTKEHVKASGDFLLGNMEES